MRRENRCQQYSDDFFERSVVLVQADLWTAIAAAKALKRMNPELFMLTTAERTRFKRSKP